MEVVGPKFGRGLAMNDASGVVESPVGADETVGAVPLRAMRVGQVARITRLSGNDDLVHRLRELGLRVGAQIQMIQPGNPCIIRLGGQKLGFRAEGAARVLVRCLPALS